MRGGVTAPSEFDTLKLRSVRVTVDSGVVLSEFETVDSGEPEGVTKKPPGEGEGGRDSIYKAGLNFKIKN